MTDVTNLMQSLNIKMAGSVEFSEEKQQLVSDGSNIIKLMQILKSDFGYKRLADMTSIDYEGYFEIVYHLHNEKAELLKIKVKVEKELGKIPSVTSLWKAAEVQEREIYDMMGIIFEGHNNLKRILCSDDFEGHPLLKTFKLTPARR